MEAQRDILLPQPAGKPCGWHLYTQAETTWDAMYRACEQASRSIDFEQYILRPDEVGLQFLRLFARKAQQGVKVRLCIDAVGSAELYFSRYGPELREAGVELLFYNPPTVPWRRWLDQMFPRDHSKIMIVDQEIVFMGGVCIDARMRDWRDTHVRLKGAIVRHFVRHFDKLWQRVSEDGRNIDPEPIYRAGEYALVLSTGKKRRNHFYKTLIRMLAEAKSEIFLTTPYFVPRRHFRKLIQAAQERGVKVTVLLSCRSNLPCLVMGREAAGKILKHDGRVFLYQNCMLHSKTLVVDDAICAVGSSNLDTLSFFHNREANLISTDASMIAELKRQFQDDLSRSKELTYVAWKRRPLREKLLSLILRPFRHIL